MLIGLAAAFAFGPGRAFFKCSHKTFKLFLVLGAAYFVQEFLELGAHRVDLAAFFFQPFQLFRTIFVERHISGC